MEERRAKGGKIRVARPLEITYSSNCPPIAARIEDISETGFFLDSTTTLEVGSVIEFTLELPPDTLSPRAGVDADDGPILGKGRVSWIQPMVGAGVEFVELDDRARERLRFFIATVHFGFGA